MAKPTNDDDVAFVQAMAEILKNNDLAELDVERGTKETGKLSLRLSRAPRVAPAPWGAGSATSMDLRESLRGKQGRNQSVCPTLEGSIKVGGTSQFVRLSSEGSESMRR